MNGERYFEQDPWDRAFDCIQTQGLGNILHISAQCVCKKGNIQERLHVWETRVERLVGEKKRGDVLLAGNAISFVGVFGDGVIVRFFLDEAAEGYSENFEIVTKKSLIVWKPNCTNQGHMIAHEGFFIEASQQYVMDLRENQC